MSLYALHIANGRTSNTGVLRPLGQLLSGSGTVQLTSTTGFAVSAQATPDMTVKVSGSALADALVITDSAGNTYYGWNTANTNVTIAANSSGSTKTDAIVAYVNTAFSGTTADNPGALVLISVRGSSGTPTSADIAASAVGSNPYLILAYVSVGNGVSSINSGNITDQRVQVTMNQPLPDASLKVAKIASEAWTTYTPTWQATGTNPTLNNGTLVGKYIKLGRYVHGRIELTIGSGTSIGSGNYTFTAPIIPATANLSRNIGVCTWVDGSNGNEFSGFLRMISSSAGGGLANALSPQYTSTTTAALNVLLSSSFMSWVAGSTFVCNFTYEAAS